jgi:hypothetical protein
VSDLFSKVSELLSDPKAAGAIRQIAASVSSPEGGEADAEPVLPELPSEGAPSVGDLPFSLSSHRREVDLLNAMRPYLRASRADKVDRALKAIRMIDLLSNFR